MKEVLKALKAQTKARVQFNELRAGIRGTPTAEQSAEMEKRAKVLTDSELALAKAVETEEAKSDIANSERRSLADRVECRNYIHASLKGVRVKGVEAELNKEIGLSDENTMPFEALVPRDDDGEHRQADVVTPVPAGAVAHPGREILRRVFRRTRASFLGVRMPMVASGEPVFPVMTGGTTAAMKAKGDSQDAAAATFIGKTIAPSRLTARYLWGVEDVARLPIEDALRADLRAVMSDELDNQLINGNGVAPNIEGVFAHLTDPADDGAVTKLNEAINKVSASVDGLSLIHI